MLDAFSGGRPECGFGRAFLPHGYPNCDGHIGRLRQASINSLLNSGAIWVGTPENIKEQNPA